MKKIKELLTRYADLKKEIVEFDRLEEKTTAGILTDARSDIPVDVQRQKIRDARLTLDLIDAKRGKLVEPHDQAKHELESTIEILMGKWNSAVEQSRNALATKLICNTVEFFENDERAARRWWDSRDLESLPFYWTHNQAFYPSPGWRKLFAGDLKKSIKHFQDWVSAHAASVSIDPESLESKNAIRLAAQAAGLATQNEPGKGASKK